MKKLFVFILLVLFSCNVLAKWDLISEDNNSLLYADISSIRKTKNIGKIWTIYNNFERGSDGTLSRKQLKEFDCINNQYRNAKTSWFTGHMATGIKTETRELQMDWQQLFAVIDMTQDERSDDKKKEILAHEILFNAVCLKK